MRFTVLHTVNMDGEVYHIVDNQNMEKPFATTDDCDAAFMISDALNAYDTKEPSGGR